MGFLCWSLLCLVILILFITIMIHDQEARSSFPSSKTDFMKLFRQRAYCVDRGYKIFIIFLMMSMLMMMMRKQGLPICHLLPWLAGLRDLLHPVPPKHQPLVIIFIIVTLIIIVADHHILKYKIATFNFFALSLILV